jgi:TorA maturation chaperone TorD
MEEARAQAQARAQALSDAAVMLRLLSRCLIDEPRQEWLQLLIDSHVFAAVPFAGAQPEAEAGLGLLQSWAAQPAAASFECAYQDYMALFVGAGQPKAPPWESFYTNKDHLLFQKETLQVRGWYKHYGLEANMPSNEPDDHLALELELCAFLLSEMAEARQNGDSGLEAGLGDALIRFLDEHLLRWLPTWCGLVEAHAKGGFYKGVSLLLRATIDAIVSLHHPLCAQMQWAL